MCGRFTLHTDPERIAAHFRVQPPVDLAPRYNIAPSQEVSAIRETENGRELILLRWGLVPFWAKEEKVGYRMINARAETVASKPAFRAAFRQRRCLIPADGFYEWQARGRGGKQPYHIKLRDDRVFAFAGLWEHWRGTDGTAVESCTVIVTEANDLLRSIHDRMPVILAPEDYTTWLDTVHFQASRLEALLRPYPAERMTAYPVSSRVNSPRNEDRDCLAPKAEG